jgi:hypothetical protein
MSIALSQGPTWRKSSYSGNQGGNCVEVAPLDGAGVGDSKDIARGFLLVSAGAWVALTGVIKSV